MRPSYGASCGGSMWAPGKVAVATATRLALACAPAPSRAPILNILNTGLWPPRGPAPRGWGGRGGEGGCGARPAAPQELEPPGPSALCPMTPLLLLLGPHGSSELTDAGAPRTPSRSLSRGDWPLPPGPSGGAPGLLSDVLSVPAPLCPRCLSPCQLCSPSPPSSPTSHLSLPCSQKHPRDVTLS